MFQMMRPPGPADAFLSPKPKAKAPEVCTAAPAPRANAGQERDVERQVSLARSLTQLGYGPAALAGVPPDMKKEVAERVAREAPSEGGGEKEPSSIFEVLEGPVGRIGDTAEILRGLQPEAEMASPLSFFAGLFDVFSGVNDLSEGNLVKGGIGTTKGVAEVVGTGAEVAGNEALAARMGPVGVAMDGASAIYKLVHGDIQGGIEDGVSTGLEAAAGPAVGAAWKTGLGVGHMLDKSAADRDLFEGRTAHEAAADTGVAANDWLGEHGADPALQAEGGAAVTIGASVFNTARSAADLVIGGPSAGTLLKENQQAVADERHRVDFFAKNRELMKKTDPQLYQMANATYGAQVDEREDTQAKLARLRKDDPYMAAAIAHWAG